MGFLDVGSEKEQVLRVLQIFGDVPLYPWSMRQLSPSEEDRVVPKNAALAALLPREPGVHSYGRLRVELLPMQAQAIYNSAFPYGFNDGPVWAGRGFTGSLTGGVAGRVGVVSFQLEPTVFEAQNKSFALMPNGQPSSPYLSGFYPGIIDLPQRFGDKPYRRFDPGQSTLRLEVGPVFAELSSADQWWGPAIEEPLILGDNAPGFLHVSTGSARPVNFLIGRLQGRIVWGRLEQSPYAPNQALTSVRFMSGFVGSFTPRGIPGLELGAARFFHSPWPADGLWHAPFGRPFEGLLKHALATTDNPTGQDADNQLASIFVRWVLPRSDVEFYGEYGREDHNVDLRDLWQEPDHDAGYSVGLQRAWQRRPDELLVVRGEILNTRLSALYQGRPQAPWYVHDLLAQGHTDLGQLLGAPGGFGGDGATVALESYSGSGKWTLRLDRLSAAEQTSGDGTPMPIRASVSQALGIERSVTVGLTDFSLNGRFVWEINRNFSADRFNLNVIAGVRRAW